MEIQKFLVENKGSFVNVRDNNIANAFKGCLSNSEKVLFMPELIDLKIVAPKNSIVWEKKTTPSIAVTGRTKQGNSVVIFAHVPNYFSDLNNVKKANKHYSLDGATVMPYSEFQRLLDLEDNQGVFVVDYEKQRKSKSNPPGSFLSISLEEAINHILVKPYLGGSKRVEEYLPLHIKNSSGLCICSVSTSDLEQPLARFLVLGDHFGLSYCSCGSYETGFGFDNGLPPSGSFCGKSSSKK